MKNQDQRYLKINWFLIKWMKPNNFQSILEIQECLFLFENIPKHKNKDDVGDREDVSGHLVHRHHRLSAPPLPLTQLLPVRWVQQLVDQSELNQAEEDKEYWAGNPDINSLGVGDRGQRLLSLYVLSGECKQSCHSWIKIKSSIWRQVLMKKLMPRPKSCQNC